MGKLREVFRRKDEETDKTAGMRSIIYFRGCVVAQAKRGRERLQSENSTKSSFEESISLCTYVAE